MIKAEEIFIENAKRGMIQFEINGFKNTYPHLFDVIVKSMNHYSGVVLAQNIDKALAQSESQIKALLQKQTVWNPIDVKPELGGEYNVVWNLKDGDYPTVTTMDYDKVTDRWVDVIGQTDTEKSADILYWAELPKPPTHIKKEVYEINED